MYSEPVTIMMLAYYTRGGKAKALEVYDRRRFVRMMASQGYRVHRTQFREAELQVVYSKDMDMGHLKTAVSNWIFNRIPEAAEDKANGRL